MRIAAGVFLIIAAVFNFLGGCFWAGAGTCTGCVGEVMEHDRLQQEKQGQSIDPWEPSPYPGDAIETPTVGDEEEANVSAWEGGGSNGGEFDEQDTLTQGEIEEIKTSGAGMALYGFAILILSGVMIGAAVCSFKEKKAKFVLITGILVIAAEVLGVLLVYFILPEKEAEEILSSMFLLVKLPGLVAGFLSILAARSFPHPLLSS
jgi:hypothetical protein